jgi:hypothetical protein
MLISGSTREASGHTAALRTVRTLAAGEVDARMYEGLAALPAFNPDLDNGDPEILPPVVRELRARIASAAAILFCTPEYAGTLPGSLKNLLDWTVGGGEMDANRARGARLRWPGRGHGHPRRPRGGAGRPCPLTGFSRTETCSRLLAVPKE